MQITKDIRWIGVNDRVSDLFEGQYRIPNGMAYHSYIIMDEKIAVTDTVDKAFGKEWMAKLKAELGEKSPDYLIVHHMEPDHSANIEDFLKAYPNATVVASDKAFLMMKQFFGMDYAHRRLVVKDGDTLSLGRHTLTFITAPMVHWPEVIMTYDSCDKVLFSADAFGKFGATDAEEDWACEARRYYFGIVGKYGTQVQKALEKLKGLEIYAICPLHGVALKEDLPYYLGLYDIWSKYEPESQGVALAFTSVYGNTKQAVELLAEELRARGCKVAVSDLARCDMAEAVEDAFRYDRLVLATTTYNGDMFPFMRAFLNGLTERGYKNRVVGMIENGSWAPMAAKKMLGMLEECKGLRYCEPIVSLRSAMSEENREQIRALAEALCQNN